MEKHKIIPVQPETKREIETLVNKFSDRPESFEHPNYQEESVRVEFINPFFKALGWNSRLSTYIIPGFHKKLSSAKTSGEKYRLEREIKATDEQIDQQVYELYGLTKQEIDLIEKG